MKVILDIKDSKADFILELLKGFPSYVKTKPISDSKAEFIANLKEAASEVRLHKQGKIKLKTAQELLNEL
jgi:hypothetical protein